MQEIIINLINKFGYFAIAFLIAFENIFPPIPSEIILTFGGFSTIHSRLNIFGVIISSTIGSLLGALVLYKIGTILNKKRLEKLSKSKLGRFIGLKKENIEKADYWFDNKGKCAVFFGRFIPIVRSLISIPAGMSEMSILEFIIYSFCGTLIWNAVLVIAGAIMGNSWTDIVNFMKNYSIVIFILLVIICIILVTKFYKNKKK